MNQIWENGKKPILQTTFGPFGLNLGPKNLLPGFYLY